MTDATRDACITGIGIITCLGEGPEATWQKLNSGEINVDDKTYAPFSIHPLGPVDFDKQIPKKGDQRQMEAWQRIGTYAAGLAIDSAGLKGNTEILSRTDMIVAAGGGERDTAVDTTILSAMPATNDPDKLLNEKLMSDLRPTLFLAQLSNLLAGNISIVHGVTGSSRTFMGEEAAGVNAVRIAVSRINAGQSEIALVGGSYNADRKEMMMLFEFASSLLRGGHAGVWDRGEHGGLVPGSLGAFLVIESRGHAEKRGAKIFACISDVMAERPKRTARSVTTVLQQMWQRIANKIDKRSAAVLSGATGAEPATREEREFLKGLGGLPVRATATYIGQALEAQFVVNVAIAAIALGHGNLFPPHDKSGLEQPMSDQLKQVVVTSVGYWRGEGMALIRAA
ncbi:MAG: beta-ketoacyl-ACP synthase [Pseudolabrys sp.]|nr:beta-ketoacyl-ACP synthase [Pseudolabrys sp.]